MDIIAIVNAMQPYTIARLALTQDALPNGIPFMGYFVELFPNATLPDPAAVTAYEATYTAAILQQSLFSALAAHRYAVQTGGTTISGIPFLTDSNSQIALMGAMILASANPAYTVDWKTPNGFVTLSATQVIGAYTAGSAFIQKCFNTEATLIADVEQYQDSPSIIAAFDAGMAA